MNDFGDRAEERDEICIRQLAAATRQFRTEFREWIQVEIFRLMPIIQLAQCTAADPAKSLLQDDIDNLNDINLNGLPKAITAIDEEIERIVGGAYDDLLDAHHYLQDSLSRLERYVRQLQDVRSRVSAWVEPDDNSPTGPIGTIDFDLN